MTKTELETMLNKMMVQNAALTALVTEQQQQIQKLQEHTAPKEERRAPGFCA